VDWHAALAWRVRRHGLDARAPADALLEVTGRIAGLHAQLMGSAELSLWARLDGVTRETAGQALWEDRTLVKTWAMRGTLHLLPAAEYGVWQGALATYRHYLKPSWFKAFAITPPQLEALLQAVAAELHGALRTRAELAAAVERRTGVPGMGQKLLDGFGAYLKPASFRGLLCFGPGEGQNVRFTHPETWLGRRDPVGADEALAAMARRFLGVYAPATREDLGRWWAVSPAQAGKLLRALGDEAAEVDVAGEPRWVPADQAAAMAAAQPTGTVRLLPAFDPYVIGATRHAERLLDDPVLRARVHRPQGWVSPVILVDGRIAGVWRHESKRSRVVVEAEPFGWLEASVREHVEEEAGRLAAFLDGALELRWTGR